MLNNSVEHYCDNIHKRTLMTKLYDKQSMTIEEEGRSIVRYIELLKQELSKKDKLLSQEILEDCLKSAEDDLKKYNKLNEKMKNLSVTSYVMNLESLPDSFEILRFTDDKKFAVIEEREDFKRLVAVEMLQEMLAANELTKRK